MRELQAMIARVEAAARDAGVQSHLTPAVRKAQVAFDQAVKLQENGQILSEDVDSALLDVERAYLAETFRAKRARAA